MYAMIGGGGGALQDSGSNGGFDGADYTSGGGGDYGGYDPIANFDYVSGNTDTGLDYLAGLGSLNPVANYIDPYTSIAARAAPTPEPDSTAQVTDQTWANVDPDAYVPPEYFAPQPAVDPYEDNTLYTPPTQAEPYEDAVAVTPAVDPYEDTTPYTPPTPRIDPYEDVVDVDPYEDTTPYTPPKQAEPYEDVVSTSEPAVDPFVNIAPPPPETPAFSDPNLLFNNPPTNTGGVDVVDPNAAMAASIQAGIDAQKRANAALAAAAAGQQVKSYVYSGDPFATNTLFGQQATSPIEGTQGKRYAFGGMTDSVPQFNNPFGPQQPTFDPRMYGQGPMQQPAPQQQSVSVGGTPQQLGLPGLLSTASQNQYPQGYTPIGQPQQNFISLGAVRN